MTVPLTDWRSPNDLYMARQLGRLGSAEHLKVLDLGCGDGTLAERLIELGFDIYGCDLEARSGEARTRLGARFGDDFDHHFRYTPEGRTGPFSDDSFDAVVANQVFEHVEDLDVIVSECARVLRHDGILLANFPLKSSPQEQHSKVPFVHWLPAGSGRVKLAKLFYRLGVGRGGDRDVDEAAAHLDWYLRTQTHYWWLGEVREIGSKHFASFEIETEELIKAVSDVRTASATGARKKFFQMIGSINGRLLSYLITRLYNAAIVMKKPVKP